MEYCPYGNLRVFLRNGRSRYSVGEESLMADLSHVFGPKNLIYFAWQITKGMAFLISRKVRILLNFLSISDLLRFFPKHKLHLSDAATILQATGWHISTTFNKFYDKSVTSSEQFW